MSAFKAYAARESALGSVINLTIGSAFFLVLFQGQTAPSVWGGQGLIVDCIPQGFMIGLMSIVPTMLITRQRALKGLAPPAGPSSKAILPRSVLGRGIVVALMTMISLVGLAAVLAWATGTTSLPFWPAFALKAVPGLVIPWIVTPPAIRAVLLAHSQSQARPA